MGIQSQTSSYVQTVIASSRYQCLYTGINVVRTVYNYIGKNKNKNQIKDLSLTKTKTITKTY